ncbi:MAG TPA: iron-binding protein [Dehalococcoidia bacterium]|nr:iron-binding protein [Chloroflexota bacterium]MBH65981.1 iron-binding protein [Chloroflexota bacterium]HCI86963.1 iron-binding protein [Dehalococcoidia bacterium]
MAEATIFPGDNGPYHVKGDFVLIDCEGNKLELTDETWLCRCGQSTEKPFCTGSHNDCDFMDVSRVAK